MWLICTRTPIMALNPRAPEFVPLARAFHPQPFVLCPYGYVFNIDTYMPPSMPYLSSLSAPAATQPPPLPAVGMDGKAAHRRSVRFSGDRTSYRRTIGIDYVSRGGRRGGPSRNVWRRRDSCGSRQRTAARLMLGETEESTGGMKTTAMIRNIPNKYTQEMLIQFLEEHCRLENQKSHEDEDSAFDFLYLPMDFRSGYNKGYAFANFTTPTALRKFRLAAHGKNWPYFRSAKICQIAYANLQGKEALEGHFRWSTFACGTESFLPVGFSPPRDGTENTANLAIRTIGRCVPLQQWRAMAPRCWRRRWDSQA